MGQAGKVNVPQLYLVAARDLFDSDAAWLQAMERAASAAVPLQGVRLALQVRCEAGAGAAALAQEARRRLRRAHPHLPLWLNARAGVGPAGYDGVHFPESALPPALGWRQGAWAASVHSQEALQQAAGAAFVVFGSIWKPQWKDAAVQGIEMLRRLASQAAPPVLAIGGITPERVSACLQAGAAGVAVASGIFKAPNVAEALAVYAAALRQQASA